MTDSKSDEPRVGMLFVTHRKMPWNSRAGVTVWHKQTLLCKVIDVSPHSLHYEVLAVLEESGRPPLNARSVTAGAVSCGTIRDGTVKLIPPTPEQLALLPPSARDLGETLAGQEYRVPRAYARRGLTLEHTGGGCTALTWEFSSGTYALITGANDDHAPTTDNEPVDVGVYGPDSGDTLDYRHCDNAEAALKYLDELTAKYSPAHLPDPQRLARDALLGAILSIRSKLGVQPGQEFGAFPDDVEDTERIIRLLTRYGQSAIYQLMRAHAALPADLPHPGQLARAFAKEVRDALTTDQLTEVVRRNRGDPNARAGRVCHTHDFIDANECMLHAWASLTRTTLIPENDIHVTILTLAWRLAALAGFRSSHIRE